MRRALLASDVPTVDEAALPGFHTSVCLACGCPSAAGDYRLAQCGDCDALADMLVQRRLANLNQKVPARDQQTPAALAAFQKTEIEQVAADRQSDGGLETK